MPIPYSNDLRSRDIDLLINKKKSQQHVEDIFSVTQATISRWLARYKNQGHCNFKGYNNNKDKIKISNPNKIKDLIEENPFITSNEVARKLNLNVTDVTI
jgi:transposase